MRIGDYEVLATLPATGRAGVVHVARAPDGREVALRLLPPGAGRGVARFHRERALRGVLGSADGFVPVIDSGTAPEGPFLVMPLLRGETLRRRLDARGRLSPGEGWSLFRELAGAIGRAHRLGYVHLALSPANVVFDDGGRPLIADLGLARHFSGLEPEHGARYRAPEQARGSRVVGFEADVFALATMLCEAVYGESPAPGERARAFVARLAAAGRVDADGRSLQVSRLLGAILDRSLAADPERRFGTGEAVAIALDLHASRRAIAVATIALLVTATAIGATSARLFASLLAIALAGQWCLFALIALDGMYRQVAEQRKRRERGLARGH